MNGGIDYGTALFLALRVLEALGNTVMEYEE